MEIEIKIINGFGDTEYLPIKAIGGGGLKFDFALITPLEVKRFYDFLTEALNQNNSATPSTIQKENK